MTLLLHIPPPIPLLMLGLLVAWVWAVSWTVRRLTRPPRRTYSWALSRGVPGDPGELVSARAFTAFTFRGHLGRLLHAWDVTGDDPGGPVVVMSHGWGESRIAMLGRVEGLLAQASRVVLWDLPGHGESEGHSGLGATERRDLLALLEVVRDGAECPVVLYGFSLGAGVSLAAAQEARVVGLVGVVLEAPYRMPQTPARAVLGGLGLPAGVTLDAALAWIGLWSGMGLFWSGFDRAILAGELRGKVRILVIHGEHDIISPVADGKDIARRCGGDFVEIQGASHLDVWDSTRREASGGAVRGFLAELGRV